MLVSILALVFLTAPDGGSPSLDFMSVRQAISGLSGATQDWLFLGFVAGFIVKVPLIPFQSWVPDAYSESPAPVTVLLAGAMSKTGAYGFLRFGIFLFPGAAHDFAPWLAGLALVNIIYGALVALVQNDLKRLLAYSSLSHMGFIILGIFALNSQGVNGAVLQMVNHGIVTPALFLAVAALATRLPALQVQDLGLLGGLQKFAPRLAALFLVLGLASLGLPGLNQFAGEFLIVGGAFLSSPVYAVVAVVGVVLAAWYTMRFFQSVWHGPTKVPTATSASSSSVVVADMRPAEFALFVPLVLLIVLLGVAPIIVTGTLDHVVSAWLGVVK
jgi:NADH-quinone oxidoreductase subunit M